MEKVALIEFGNSHDEVLYPQYRFLQNSSLYEPVLFCSKALEERLFEYPKESLYFLPDQPKGRDFRKLHHQLAELGISKVVINTASGKRVRNFLWFNPNSSLRYYGVLHNLRKLEGSTTQALISFKMKRYFLLADYLKETAEIIKPKLNFESFKAAFLPAEIGDPQIKKPKGEQWIVIPGQVEYKRRDYLGLLEGLDAQKIPAGLRFILLGKSKHEYGNGQELEQEIEQRGLKKHFLMWDGFIANPTFYAYLSQADFVLPLIHANHESGSLYQNQISGAWNMAFSFQIPLLMHSMWAHHQEFKDAAIFYSIQELPNLWSKLDTVKKGDFYQSEDWQFSQQAQKYCDFLSL